MTTNAGAKTPSAFAREIEMFFGVALPKVQFDQLKARLATWRDENMAAELSLLSDSFIKKMER